MLCASSRDYALRVAERTRPDAIVIDSELGVPTLLQDLRGLASVHAVPVIMLGSSQGRRAFHRLLGTQRTRVRDMAVRTLPMPWTVGQVCEAVQSAVGWSDVGGRRRVPGTHSRAGGLAAAAAGAAVGRA